MSVGAQTLSWLDTMSSARLRRCESFLRVLLSADRLQGEALLVTASKHQVNCLTEIMLNILRLPVGKKAKALITKSRKILRAIADFGLSVAQRLKIIQRAAVKVFLVIQSVRNKLKLVLRQKQQQQ